MDHFDLCIVGAGVVGLAIANTLAQLKPPSYSILLLEKNAAFGQETSSRNSEVIHAGLYYAPGSLKAQLCVEGNARLYAYCHRHSVPFRRTGKLIVAHQDELAALENLHRRALENGVKDLQFLSRSELTRKEPEVRADAALFSPSTGVIDSHALMLSFLEGAQRAGVEYVPNTRVSAVKCLAGGFEVVTQHHPSHAEEYRFRCSALVNAGGLHAQTLAHCIEGADALAIPRLQLSKGHYFKLQGRSPFAHLVYPLPDPQQRGLGIHACLDLSGAVRFGPDIEATDQLDYQVDTNRKAQFIAAITRYYPGLDSQKLVADYAGIRPKLASPDGEAMDFQIQTGEAVGLPGLIQLFGIESPGLTASLAIAHYVAQRLP